MKKLLLAIIVTVVGVSTFTSCGDPDDESNMYNWKDVWYAFDMVEDATSLKGLHVDITYVDRVALERKYDYKGFGQWDTIFTRLPWGFIPRMKATIIQPEDLVFTESDFPAVIHLRMGISDGDQLPARLEVKEEFATLSEFTKYINDMAEKTYKVYPASTEIEKE
ncbi:MAG: hypothetical protein IKK64_07670 [Bacteroidales bacterium]|nr:hypothetical protein [Bacteroidales bacterium]